MLTKTVQFYTTLAFYIMYSRSISITSIVRFKCDTWKIKAEQGCWGTFILPDLVLTTSFCAENCQSVANMSIAGKYINTHYKSYVHSHLAHSIIARNDIALVRTPRERLRKRKLIRLSALDSISTLGQKALIPIMDADKPRLQVTLIEHCYIQQPFGYYVCTANKLTRNAIKVCRERQEQGVPLLLDDRIFGLMGIPDTASCLLPQRTFVAIGPALYWITATVTKMGYSPQLITTLHDSFTQSIMSQTVISTTILNQRRAIGSIIRNTSSSTPTSSNNRTLEESTTSVSKKIITSSKSTTTEIRNRTSTSESSLINFNEGQKKMDLDKYFRYVHNMNEQLFHDTPTPWKKNYSKPATTTTLTTKTTTVKKPEQHLTSIAAIMRGGAFTITTKETTKNPNAAITFIPAPTLKTKKTTTLSTTTPATLRTIPFFKLNEHNKTTNVMDWFSAMVRDNIKNSSSMYYVIGSSTTSRRPLNFIDLT